MSPLTGWRLTYVTNRDDSRTLRYDVTTSPDSCCGVVYVTLRKSGHAWTIEDYERIY
jgi:hypothetical protein